MIIFQNEGLIDLDAATVMGASIKDSDSAIGYFGTGFKFPRRRQSCDAVDPLSYIAAMIAIFSKLDRPRSEARISIRLHG